MQLYFNFYRVRVEVISDDEQILEDIKRDFSYFLSSKQNPTIKVSVFNRVAPYQEIPPLKASLYMPDSISYDDRNTRYVDYQGRLLTIYDYHKDEARIYSKDPDLLHEISYLLILSRVGELLDKRGIHRIHSLGFTFKRKGVLLLLPQGGGKSLLALELLKDPEVRLISEDTPLITHKGEILPFPLRMGVGKTIELGIPSKYLRDFTRRKYGQKTLIDIEYFKDRIAGISRLAFVLIGEREFSNRARINKIGKVAALSPIIRNIVFGLGLPQLIEYFLRKEIKDIFNKLRIVASRLIVTLRILKKSKTYKFTIGRNKKENIQVLLNFLKKGGDCSEKID